MARTAFWKMLVLSPEKTTDNDFVPIPPQDLWVDHQD